MVDDRSAALLVRVWLEDAGEFRARLLTLHDVTEERPPEETTMAVVSSPGEVFDAVRDWLEGFARQTLGSGEGDG